MLREAWLELLAAACVLLGIAVLSVSVALKPTEPISVGDLLLLPKNSKVYVQGTVKWAYKDVNILVLVLYGDGSTVKVVRFAPTVQEFFLVKPYSRVRVKGRLVLYKGIPEIVAEEISHA